MKLSRHDLVQASMLHACIISHQVQSSLRNVFRSDGIRLELLKRTNQGAWSSMQPLEAGYKDCRENNQEPPLLSPMFSILVHAYASVLFPSRAGTAVTHFWGLVVACPSSHCTNSSYKVYTGKLTYLRPRLLVSTIVDDRLSVAHRPARTGRHVIR